MAEELPWSKTTEDILQQLLFFLGQTWIGSWAIWDQQLISRGTLFWDYCRAGSLVWSWTDRASLRTLAILRQMEFLQQNKKCLISYCVDENLDFLPSKSTIMSIWEISLNPGNRGLWAKSSPKMQPVAHMSMAVVWKVHPNSNSGGRYHKVTNPGVIGVFGTLKVLASPKSAKKFLIFECES